MAEPTPGAATALAALPDGGAVVARSAAEGATGAAAWGEVVRLTAAGRRDVAFGQGGRADLPAELALVRAVAVDPVGRITVLGSRDRLGQVPVLVRLTASGVLDQSFAGGGVADLSADGFAVSLAVRPDGTALVGGGQDGRVTVVAVDGSRSALTVPSPVPEAHRGEDEQVAPAADGGVLAVMRETTALPGGKPTTATVVTRLTAAGTPDPAYGTGGRLVLAAATHGYDLLPTPDGGFVVRVTEIGPASDVPLNRDVGLARIAPAGKLFVQFAGDGVAELGLPAGATRPLVSLTPLADGRTLALAAGLADGRVFARVFTAAGRPDPAVADGGWLAVPADGFSDPASGLPATATGPGGRVLLLGAVGGMAGGSWQYTTRLAALDLTAPTPAGQTVPAGVSGPAAAPGVLAEVQPPVVPAASAVVRPPVNDLDGDGVADRVETAGPRVAVRSGTDGSILVSAFAPFEAGYTGPLNSVLADADGDGRAELVVAPGAGGGPVVAVFDAAGRQRGRFFGIDDPNFRGGVGLAAGDLTADGAADLVVTAGAGGGPRVAVFDGRTVAGEPQRLVGDFFAFEPEERGGVTAVVADGMLVFGAGPGGGPRVRTVAFGTLRAAAPPGLDSLPPAAVEQWAGDPAARGGVRLSTRSEGDRLAVVAESPGRPPAVVWQQQAADGSPADPLASHAVTLGDGSRAG